MKPVRRRRRGGFTLMELIVVMGIMLMVLFGSVTLLLAGLESFAKTTSFSDISTSNANGIRWVDNVLHQATAVSVSADGTTVTYQLPEVSSTLDSVTGQYELVDPITPDGINRTFQVSFTSGTLTDSTTGNVLVNNIIATDPQNSNATYRPFTLTTIGSKPAVTVNLIAEEQLATSTNYVRLKCSSIYHN